jgi:hypothetical protein
LASTRACFEDAARLHFVCAASTYPHRSTSDPRGAPPAFPVDTARDPMGERVCTAKGASSVVRERQAPRIPVWLWAALT